ncbi:PAS domain-containing sensor histidine kinase [Halobaculum marinum]|uniref:histidine kinase n=1 Tax=Halobaculum marinum TaxID=3031996 RepID=A0ABD5X249_9EURY|nr:PAS domain-containing sensor histidine kinase [Halobaculum sp. DT55]
MNSRGPSDAISSQTLCDTIPDAIVIVDEAGAVTYANSRVTDLFGYAPEELVGEAVEVLVPDGIAEAHVDKRESYMADPQTRPMGVGLDLVGQRKDGSQFPVAISLSPVDTDDDNAVVATVRDVSDQETLRNKYRSLLETAPDAFLLADASSGELVEVNEQAVELTGYSQEELQAMDQRDLHPSGHEEGYRKLFEEHVRSEGIRSTLPDGTPIFVETKDGDKVPVEINARIIEVDDRRLIAGSFRDISERHEYERRLERRNERLDEFASLVTHDLRNPLNVASGYLDLIAEELDSEYVDHVESSHDRMKAIIDGTLALAREGDAAYEEGPVDLASLAEQCWRNVEGERASLHVASTAVLSVDSRRLERVFENLYRNAIEHGGPAVTIEVGMLDNGFYVEDDGPGVPESGRDDVFQAGQSSTATGTGLGLAIVRRIVEGHGWAIDVTDGAVGGARFEITGVEEP